MFLAVDPEREIVEVMGHIGGGFSTFETTALLIDALTLKELRIGLVSDCQKEADVLYH